MIQVSNKPRSTMQNELSEAGESVLATLTEMHRQTLLEHEAKRSRRVLAPVTSLPSLPTIVLAAAEESLHRTAPAVWDESQRIAERMGRPPHPGCVYLDMRRDLQVGTSSAGGYLKGVQVAPGGYFGQTMHDTSLARELGVAEVPVTGDANFPRIVTPASITWLDDETSTATESGATFGVASTTPKTVSAYFEASRQLLKQASQSAIDFVTGELGRGLQHAVNAALVNGSGASGQPTGIIGTTGVGSQSGTTLAWAGVIEMMRLVEANGPFLAGRAAWVMDAATAKLLRTRERAAGAGLILNNGEVGGYRALVTTAMPASSLLFGDFSGVVLPTWGVLEIGADPYMADGGAGFKTGIVGIRAIWSVDVAVLRPASFAKSTSIT
jgi:HK97 family phage major capsid protein